MACHQIKLKSLPCLPYNWEIGFVYVNIMIITIIIIMFQNLMNRIDWPIIFSISFECLNDSIKWPCSRQIRSIEFLIDCIGRELTLQFISLDYILWPLKQNVVARLRKLYFSNKVLCCARNTIIFEMEKRADGSRIWM